MPADSKVGFVPSLTCFLTMKLRPPSTSALRMCSTTLSGRAQIMTVPRPLPSTPPQARQ